MIDNSTRARGVAAATAEHVKIARARRKTAVDQLTNALKADPSFEWTAEKMTDIAGYTLSALCRIFKQAHGIGPAKFLSNPRFQMAENLLETTNDKVSDICCTVGFSSPGAFSTSFQKRYGMSPTEYRERARNNVESDEGPHT